MGPAATVDLMARIIAMTPARRDQDHLPVIASSATQIPDRTLAILGQGPSPLPAMIEAMQPLVASCACAILIPCNTAHHWFDELQVAAGAIPILHIADAVARLLPENGAIGLLATSGTLRAGIYQRRWPERQFVIPDPISQEKLVSAGISAVKGGLVDMGATLIAQAASELFARGASSVVMGCTEIPIALADHAARDPRLIDPTAALAAMVIDRFFTDHTAQPDQSPASGMLQDA